MNPLIAQQINELKTMRYITIFLIFTLAACQTTKRTEVPSVAPVKESLTAISESIEAAGDSNSAASQHVKTALELADELEVLLNKIESEQAQ